MKINGSFFILTALILIFLKLIGEITWSWIWVLSPLWLPFVIPLVTIVVGLSIIITLAIIVFIIEAIVNRLE